MCRHSVISDSLFTTDHPYNHIWHAHLRLKKIKQFNNNDVDIGGGAGNDDKDDDNNKTTVNRPFF